MGKKKLIEVALPLDKINAESAREKSTRQGHPSTLHLWWARRPLAAARAVIWSSLVDDPSSHPDQFPTEESQNIERKRLFKILEDLVVWENSTNKEVLRAAKAEIKKSIGDEKHLFLDPFSGGGAIPLEAQRLGLHAYAHDLNPIPVMINKATIEIPPIFANLPPVNPKQYSELTISGWQGAAGLATDIKYYGDIWKNKAYSQLGHLYPSARLPKSYGGGFATVISWIWARTAKCPNPACGCTMPLTSTFVLSKKKGKEAWAKPIPTQTGVEFEVRYEKCPKEYESFKIGRGANFKCPCCGEITADAYIKHEGKMHRIGYQLMAVVAEGKHGRIYCNPDVEHVMSADVPMPDHYPTGELPNNPRWFSPPAFGMTCYEDLFTKRQLTTLVALCDLIPEIQSLAEADAVKAGLKNDHLPLRVGGKGARAYGEAVGIYLAFAIDRLAMTGNSLVRWNGVGEKAQHCYGRQALPMLWDFAEVNFFGNATGSIDSAVFYSQEPLYHLPTAIQGTVKQVNAQSDCGLRNIVISTDPPYYDNIGYADLSDFFYVWMRQSLKDTYPELFTTMLVPKAEELIATPYRHNGSMEKAKAFFEDGMLSACKQIYQYAREDIPVTIYYAYKQSETNAITQKTSSSGWETMLSAIVNSGFAITGTWPIRTEMATRQIS